MSVMPGQGLHGRRFFCSPLLRLLGKWGLAQAQKGNSPSSEQSPPVPVPIFLMQHLLFDDNGERTRLTVRCGTPPILLLTPLKIDGSERGPRLSYSTEIALDLASGPIHALAVAVSRHRTCQFLRRPVS